MPRMKILNALEQDEFESPPIFNSVERKRFFDLPVRINKIAAGMRTPTNQICFLLIAGYFRAAKKFFSARFHQNDIDYLAQRRGVSVSEVNPLHYEQRTFERHCKLIRVFYGFKELDEPTKQALRREITSMVSAQLKPKLIFFQAVEFLIRRKVSVPSCYLLTDLILEQIRRYKLTIAETIERNLSAKGKELLDSLLEKVPSEAPESELSGIRRYRLTLLKRFSQSTRPVKIKASVEDLQTLRSLYWELAPVINALGFTCHGLRYYAGSVIKSEIFQVARRADEDRYLHLSAFIAYQYFSLQDTLIDILLKVTRSYLNFALQEHKEICYEDRRQKNHSLRRLVRFVDGNLLGTLAGIRSIAESAELSDAEKVQSIKALLKLAEPEQILVQEEIEPLKKEAESRLKDEDFYNILERRSAKLQNKTALILKNIGFKSSAPSADLTKALEYYKRKDGHLDWRSPTDFLEPGEEKAIYDARGNLRVSLYKALLALKVADSIKSGALNVEHSYKYRPLDDYLIPQADWQREKEGYIQRAGLGKFIDPEKHLLELAQSLDQQYGRTNRNILDGKNSHIQFRPRGSFTLATPKVAEVETDPLGKFFPEKQYISLLEILSTINRITGFVEEFEHWQVRYNRARPRDSVFLAGIVGYGCEIGAHRIARISKHVTESEVENTVNWHFTVDNIHNAVDRILKLMDQLELPNIYRREKDKLHTSSDGQKFEVDVDSLNASHSFKYFGKGKGVSVYSFIDERHMLFHSTVISAAERESAYVIDGLMHNDVVKSDIHSTDTHGFSEVICAVMHLLGFSFAPRIKDLKKRRLYTFENKRQYEELGYKLLPEGYIDTALIAENWDDILRFIATIKLKISTASDLFRRLNSYSKQHILYKALKEFGKIPKSQHILVWVDDLTYRQAVEKQLNKAESSNKLAKAVTVGNSRQFSMGEKYEQEIAEGCKRLIKNAIICWNYLYMSQKIADESDEARRSALIEIVRKGSVVCWQHINMLGEYDFSEERLQDSIGFQLPKILSLKASNFDAQKSL